jgi:DNA-binding CsgD family transcriptional regulator
VREVSARLLGLCLGAWRASGEKTAVALDSVLRGLDLPLLPTSDSREPVAADPRARFAFSSYLTLLDRLASHFGSLGELENAFALAAGEDAGLAAFAPGFDSLWSFVWFANTVLAPADFTCQHTVMRAVREGPAPDSYELWYVLGPGYRGSEPLVHAAVGLLRGQPLAFRRPAALVEFSGCPEEFLCRVTLSSHERASSLPPPVARATRRESFDGVLADAAAYRHDGHRMARVLEKLGKVNELDSFQEVYASDTLAVLREDFGLAHVALWRGQGAARTRLAAAGEPRVPAHRLDLVVRGTAVGELEIDGESGVGPEPLLALLPMIAWGLEARGATPKAEASEHDDARPPSSSPPASASRPARSQRCVVPASWKLTRRQTEIVTLIAAGLGNKEIAARLGCAVGTIEDRLTVIYEKAGVDGRLGVLVAVLRDSP